MDATNTTDQEDAKKQAKRKLKAYHTALENQGYHFGVGLMKAIASSLLIGVVCIIIASAVSNALWPKATDDSDGSATERSGFKLQSDWGTGCQYLVTPQGHATPRLNPDGTTFCTGPQRR